MTACPAGEAMHYFWAFLKQREVIKDQIFHYGFKHIQKYSLDNVDSTDFLVQLSKEKKKCTGVLKFSKGIKDNKEFPESCCLWFYRKHRVNTPPEGLQKISSNCSRHLFINFKTGSRVLGFKEAQEHPAHPEQGVWV